ncbi:hypothetical protein [Humibacter sp.]|uniref:hypothetical protein n=1 Tax=Humibacter sp. TaxID=1940291 RepID=UPI002CA43F7F|nr:hypothetical protein [Humibacter sp.]HVX09318.1 hypothetical protein [Humibacter sp.]
MTADDELRAVLHAHTIDAPDADAVHAGIRSAIGRRRRQRQRTQTAGVAILVGGLAVGVPVLARNDHRPSSRTPGGRATAVPGSTVASAAPPSPAKKHPGGRDVPSSTTSPLPESTFEDDLVARFFTAGYGYDDAVTLVSLWHLGTPYDAKAFGGQLLEDGHALPITPGSRKAADAGQADAARNAFRQHHDVTDAQRIAAAWNLTDDDLGLVKALAGQRLLDGQSIPL